MRIRSVAGAVPVREWQEPRSGQTSEVEVLVEQGRDVDSTVRGTIVVKLGRYELEAADFERVAEMIAIVKGGRR